MRKKKTAVVISCDASEKLFHLLEEKKIHPILTKKLDVLDSAVADHVDLQIHPITNTLWMCCRELYSYYKKELGKYHVEVIAASQNLKREYPGDCLLNAYHDESYYFANRKAIDPKLKEYLDLYYREIHVTQGYTKCNIAKIGKTLVSGDRIIIEKAKEQHLFCEKIPGGGIALAPYDTGFIGGTCGIINDKEILFYGDIEQYRYRKELCSVLTKEGITAIYPKKVAFEDRGSIFAVHEEGV